MNFPKFMGYAWGTTCAVIAIAASINKCTSPEYIIAPQAPQTVITPIPLQKETPEQQTLRLFRMDTVPGFLEQINEQSSTPAAVYTLDGDDIVSLYPEIVDDLLKTKKHAAVITVLLSGKAGSTMAIFLGTPKEGADFQALEENMATYMRKFYPSYNVQTNSTPTRDGRTMPLPTVEDPVREPLKTIDLNTIGLNFTPSHSK